MKRYSLDPEGMRRFNRDMRKRLAGAIQSMAERGVNDVCAMVALEAKRRCPVGVHRGAHRAGTLRQSIAYEVRRRGNRVVGAVGSDVEYATYVEFGTRFIRVGTPQAPRTNWPAKAEHGGVEMGSQESMPYLRAAIWAKRRDVRRVWKRVVGGK